MTTQRENRTILATSPENLDSCPVVTIKLDSIDKRSDGLTHNLYVLDINNSGMGITCEILLKVGQTLLFEKNDLDWDLPQKGVVMWTFKAQDGFRAGIKFIIP